MRKSLIIALQALAYKALSYPMFRNKYFAATDVGLQRDNNEDAYFGSPRAGLWVVADGMGGHAAGEVASALVVETIHREVRKGESLENAIKKSHHDILSAANSGVGGIGMGSTVIALHSTDQTYKICWVGDSRAYLLSQPSNANEGLELRQLSTDHSYVQMLFQSGAITEAELDTHPEKNIITQCLGSVELPEVQVDQIVGEWPEKSKILLCSDGLSDVVTSDQIKQIINDNADPQRAIDALIRSALDAGGKDNITAAIIEAPCRTQLLFQKIKKRLVSL